MDFFKKVGNKLDAVKKHKLNALGKIPKSPDDEFQDALIAFRAIKGDINGLVKNAELFLATMQGFTASLESVTEQFDSTMTGKDEAAEENMPAVGTPALALAASEFNTETQLASIEWCKENVLQHLHVKQQALDRIEASVVTRQAKKQEYDYYVEKMRRLEQLPQEHPDTVVKVQRNKPKLEAAKDALDKATQPLLDVFAECQALRPKLVAHEFEQFRKCQNQFFSTASERFNALSSDPSVELVVIPALPDDVPEGMRRVAVTVPEGVEAGQRFNVDFEGSTYNIACPEGSEAGMRILVDLPVAKAKEDEAAAAAAADAESETAVGAEEEEGGEAKEGGEEELEEEAGEEGEEGEERNQVPAPSAKQVLKNFGVAVADKIEALKKHKMNALIKVPKVADEEFQTAAARFFSAKGRIEALVDSASIFADTLESLTDSLRTVVSSFQATMGTSAGEEAKEGKETEGSGVSEAVGELRVAGMESFAQVTDHVVQPLMDKRDAPIGRDLLAERQKLMQEVSYYTAKLQKLRAKKDNARHQAQVARNEKKLQEAQDELSKASAPLLELFEKTRELMPGLVQHEFDQFKQAQAAFFASGSLTFEGADGSGRVMPLPALPDVDLPAVEAQLEAEAAAEAAARAAEAEAAAAAAEAEAAEAEAAKAEAAKAEAAKAEAAEQETAEQEADATKEAAPAKPDGEAEVNDASDAGDAGEGEAAAAPEVDVAEGAPETKENTTAADAADSVTADSAPEVAVSADAADPSSDVDAKSAKKKSRSRSGSVEAFFAKVGDKLEALGKHNLNALANFKVPKTPDDEFKAAAGSFVALKQHINALTSDAENFRAKLSAFVDAVEQAATIFGTNVEEGVSVAGDGVLTLQAASTFVSDARTQILGVIDTNVLEPLKAKQVAVAAIEEAVIVRQKAKREHDYYVEKNRKLQEKEKKEKDKTEKKENAERKEKLDRNSSKLKDAKLALAIATQPLLTMFGQCQAIRAQLVAFEFGNLQAAQHTFFTNGVKALGALAPANVAEIETMPSLPDDLDLFALDSKADGEDEEFADAQENATEDAAEAEPEPASSKSAEESEQKEDTTPAEESAAGAAATEDPVAAEGSGATADTEEAAAIEEAATTEETPQE